MADYEIIVIATPEKTILNNPSPPSVPISGPGDAATTAIRQNGVFAANLLTSNDDVTEKTVPDILVVGKRFKDLAGQMAIATTYVKNGNLNIPCLGVASGLRGTLLSMRFTLTNKIFQEGRAGANYADGTNITKVDVNATTFRNYIRDYGDGGAGFILLHEVAHTFKIMRDLHQQKFTEYRNGAGNGLDLETQRTSYTGTPGFVEVEAKANTIASELYKALSNGKDFGFQPKYGYFNC